MFITRNDEQNFIDYAGQVECYDCANAAGYTPKDKTVGVWLDECGICHRIRPCTDLCHDWNPPKGGQKKGGEE